MANIFQKLGLLKKEGEDPEDQQAPIIKPIVQPTTVVSMGDSTPPVAKSNTDYSKYLEDVLDKANQPGVDFLEFHKALNSFDGKPLTEQQKYEFAYLPIKAMGIDAQALESTGRDYLSVLSKENQSFQNELATAIREKVENKKAEIQKLTAENAELNSKIEANSRQIEQMNQDVFAASSSIDVEKQAFEYALSNKVAIINDRITKIQTYLHGNPTI